MALCNPSVSTEQLIPAVENAFIYPKLLGNTGQDPAMQYFTLGHSNISMLYMFCTAWNLQTASAASLRKAHYHGCPMLISVCLHWIFRVSLLHFVRFTLRHTCIGVLSKGTTEKQTSCHIRRRISESQRSDRAWPRNKLLKNRTDHFSSMITTSKSRWEMTYSFVLK